MEEGGDRIGHSFRRPSEELGGIEGEFGCLTYVAVDRAGCGSASSSDQQTTAPSHDGVFPSAMPCSIAKEGLLLLSSILLLLRLSMRERKPASSSS